LFDNAGMCAGLYDACPPLVIDYLKASSTFQHYLDCSDPTLYDQDSTTPCSTLTTSTAIPCNTSNNNKPLIYPGVCEAFNFSAAKVSGGLHIQVAFISINILL
jgi:hypothetical protein